MQYEEFKLDAASLTDPLYPDQRIIAYHFNIPQERNQDRATFERVLHQVETDFPLESRHREVLPLYFQISAVYTLIHRDTGAERLWQGSFNPRARDLGRLTDFRVYDPRTFVDYALPRCQTERVLTHLRNANDQQETVWTVGDILSIIISFQCTVTPGHPIFTLHPELGGHHLPPPQIGRRGQRNGGRQRGAARGTRRAVFRLNLG